MCALTCNVPRLHASEHIDQRRQGSDGHHAAVLWNSSYLLDSLFGDQIEKVQQDFSSLGEAGGCALMDHFAGGEVEGGQLHCTMHEVLCRGLHVAARTIIIMVHLWTLECLATTQHRENWTILPIVGQQVCAPSRTLQPGL